MQALLACDDTDETAILSLVLQLTGLTVNVTGDLNRAIRRWSERPADLVMLALRGGSTAEMVRYVRRHTEVPLMVISGTHDEGALCRLFEAGADVVVPRPYGSSLLVAQLRAFLRRSRGTPVIGLPTLGAGKLSLDSSTRQVKVEGRPSRRLTQLEFRMLYVLMMHRGQTLSPETIVERVWGYNEEGSMELVRGLISRLRAKVELDPKSPQYIITVPGAGYRFAMPVTSDDSGHET